MTITRKFRSVGWVAAVSSAALACYLVSYRVSAERSALEDVEREIAQARDDIHELNTEFETRSRMSQLEHWNRRDFVLAAPTAEQVLDGEVELAALFDPDRPSQPIQYASLDLGQTSEAAPQSEPFDVPDPDGLDMPRIQQATYLVPQDIEQRARAERIAFLDDQLRGEIAVQAAHEYGDGDYQD